MVSAIYPFVKIKHNIMYFIIA